MNVLITCPRVEISRESFNKFFSKNNINSTFVYPTSQGFTSNELINIYENQEILIVGDDEVDEKFLNSAKNLKQIIKWGKGTDNIDKKVCEQRGVSVTNSPGNLAKYVAEHALSLILSLFKKILQNRDSLKNNEWFKESSLSLHNTTVGFYGFGAIANELSKILEPFNCNIIYYDIENDKDKFEYVELEKLFKNSDTVVVAAELTKENEGEINSQLFQLMKPSSVIINISRGKIINQKDLIDALKNHNLLGAGLDVLENEPVGSNDPIVNLENVLITCHNASNTNQASIDVNNSIIEIIGKML